MTMQQTILVTTRPPRTLQDTIGALLGWALVRGREVKNLDDIRSLLIRRTVYYKK